MMKGCGMKRYLLNLRHYPDSRLDILMKITNNLSHDNRSPGRDLKPWPAEYKAGMLSVDTSRNRPCMQFLPQFPT
jgi:hypothetical protein